MEMVVPRFARQASSSQVGHRAALVLMHVDGSTAIISIAKMVGLPVDEVVECFHELEAAGLVDLFVAAQRVAITKSGICPRYDPLDAVGTEEG